MLPVKTDKDIIRYLREALKIQEHNTNNMAAKYCKIYKMYKAYRRSKRQASSSKQRLTAGPGYDRMYLERNIMEHELKRIADALELVIQMVKKDQEKFERYKEETTEKWDQEAAQ